MKLCNIENLVYAEVKFSLGESAMTQNTKGRRMFCLDEIERTQELLRNLTPKKTRKTRKETIELLRVDILKAIENGYNPKELLILFKESGLPISGQLVADIMRTKKRKFTKKSTVLLSEGSNRSEAVEEYDAEQAILRSGFEIVADTLDEEL